ncbi:MAG: NAD+ synthase [Halobacteriota archaeon]
MYSLALNKDALSSITGQLKRFIKARVKSANARGAVVALSGGVDSSVVAALAHDVVNTKALILPEKGVTSEQDVLDATSIAEAYKLSFTIININDLVNCFKESARPILPAHKIDLLSIAEANLKPRIRMALNYVASNAEHRLVLGTGNRTELLTGYFTKYGDGGVDALPIGGLYKTQVFQLARSLDIPESIISKAPSAGLWVGQTDEEELGISYSLLDQILYELIDEKNTVDVTAQLLGVESRQVQSISSQVKHAAHKRRVPLIAQIR